MPRKHLIASGINKKQQSQAKVWNKLAKEIKVAAKVGGPNPDTNARLKNAIDKALQNNLSRDSIQKNINGATIDKSNQVDYLFEIYGQNSLMIMVAGLTDNQNRLISSLNRYVSKINGTISSPNSVKVHFNYYGEILIEINDENKNNIEELELKIMNICTENNLDLVDIIINDDCVQVLVNPNSFYKTKEEFEKNNVKILISEIKYIPNEYIDLNKDNYDKLEKFLISCEDDEDIQWVVTNFGEVK